MNKLQIDLTADEASVVLEALGHLPYNRVVDLIASIQRQAQQQMPFGKTNERAETAVDERQNSIR